jgi:hypothetical protein
MWWTFFHGSGSIRFRDRELSPLNKTGVNEILGAPVGIGQGRQLLLFMVKY